MEARKTKLASTTVVTKPEDTLATVDVYLGAPNKPTNNILSALTSEFNKGLDALNKFANSKTSKDLTTFVNSITKVAKVDVNKALSDLAKGNINIDDLGKSLGKSLLDGFKANPMSALETIGLGGIANELAYTVADAIGAPGVSIVMAGRTLLTKIDDIDSLKSLDKIVGLVTKDENLMDIINLTDKFKLTSTIMNFADKIGISDIADRLKVDLNEDDLKKFFASSVKSFVNEGNVKRIKESIETCGIDWVKAENPKIVEDVLFKSYSDLGTIIDLNTSNELVSMLETIDTNWWKIQRNGTYIPNIEVFKNINRNVRQLLLFNDTVRDYVALHNSFPAMEFKTLANKTYKATGIV